MLRKIYPYLWFSAAMLLACWACSDDDAVTEAADSEAYTLTLQLSSGAMATRVATDAIAKIAALENLMKRIDLYFFPKPSADGQVGETSVFKYSVDVDDAADNKLGWQTLTVKLPLDKVDDLFGPEGTTCDVYAVVNWNGTDPLPESITRSALGETVVTEALDGDTDNNGEMAIDGLPTFVMYGQATSGNGKEITLDRTTQTAKGEIWVRHVAAKIRIVADIEEAVYVDQQKWVAQTENIRAYITNGTMSAQMNGLLEHGQGDQQQEFKPVYFSLTDKEGSRRILTEDTNETEPGNWYWNSIPFYSHPNHWENTPTPDENNRRTYLTVVVPWTTGEGADREFVPTYYQVPINVTGDSDHEANCLKSNHYYKVYVKIGMLGSFTQEEEVVLDASYKIVDWGQADIDVNITETRFLVVNQTDWVVNGEESVTIPFYSSHDVEVVSILGKYYRFNDTWTAGGRSYKGETGDVHERTFKDELNARKEMEGVNTRTASRPDNNYEGLYTYSVNNTEKTVTLTHPLVIWTEYRQSGTEILNTNAGDATYYFRNKSTTPEYSKYVFEIVIRHNDVDAGTAFEETLYITQYPPIYIEAELNTASKTAAASNGYTFVNGYRGTSDPTDATQHWKEVMNFPAWGQGYGDNQNPNMYIIHISQLSEVEGASYSIGDPRTLYINNQLSGTSALSTQTNDITATWTTWVSSSINSYNQAHENPTTAPALYDGNPNRRLKYYYPTSESDEMASVISPMLRIASSFGKCTPQLNREEARRRCAAYQEFGYPAGRWRLPTKAEFEYITNLSSTDKIPLLFNTGSAYWTAQGGYKNSGNGAEADEPVGGVSIRCVYDEWYWVKEDGTPDKCGITTFTWGDKPKVNPQN